MSDVEIREPAIEMERRAGVDALTSDGAIVRLRAACRGDAAALREMYEASCDANLYLRFFTVNRRLVGPEVARLVRATGPDHAALVADEAGVVVGVASYETLPSAAGGAREAEFAVFVADGHHGRGIGTLLVEHLAQLARRHGIEELVGEMLASNVAMLQVVSGLRPVSYDRTGASEVVEVRLATTPGEDVLAAIDARDRAAERRSLAPMLAPKVVAVVGAGREPGGVGHEVLEHLRTAGYTGRVYAINPHASMVGGVPAYSTVRQVPERVDLAVIAVPAAAVAQVVEDCAFSGVPAVVVLSSGYADRGPAGQEAQRELVRRCRAAGIRLVGPNCLGILNTHPDIQLAATFAAVDPPAGRLGVASQSGAVGVALLDHARRTGTGVSTFVSLGNKADVSSNDLLAYWCDDPDTAVVAFYLESFGNPRRFARLARTLARRKPLLVVKSGRSVGGQRAGMSHTAAAATPEVAVDSLFAQAGLIRTDTLGELLDAARLFVDQPLPAGTRLGVVGNAGGANVLAADAAETAGLTVPELTAALQARLGTSGSATRNPVDLGAVATSQQLGAAIEEMAGSGEVDAILVVYVRTRASDAEAAVAAIAAAADRAVALPVAAVLLGIDQPPATLGDRRTPVYPLPEQAVHALGRAARYAAWRRTPPGTLPELANVDGRRAHSTVAAAVAAGGGWQDTDTTHQLLRCYGIPVLPTRVATDVNAVAAAADDIGYPVAVKAADPSLVHKSDIGAVRLGLTDQAAIRRAYQTIAAAVAAARPASADAPTPVLVQPMAAPGVELVAGIVHDPLFGSLVMCGLGGVHTDLLADRSYRMLPVTDVDATRMWQTLRGAPLLTGYRGTPKADIAAVEDLLQRLGRLADNLPEVAELDLNPVVAAPDGCVVVDAKLRLVPVHDEPDQAVRALL